MAAPKLLLAFALAAIATAAALSGCASSSSTGAVPTPATTSSAPSPSSPSDPATGGTLVGTWRTAALPTASWATTYRRVGGTATQAAAFVERIGGRIGSTETVTLRVGDKDWVQFGQADEDAPGQGSSGTYELKGTTATFTTNDSDIACTLLYAVRVTGDTLTVRVISEGPRGVAACSDPDELRIQHALYETASFQRVPA